MERYREAAADAVFSPRFLPFVTLLQKLGQ